MGAEVLDAGCSALVSLLNAPLSAARLLLFSAMEATSSGTRFTSRAYRYQPRNGRRVGNFVCVSRPGSADVYGDVLFFAQSPAGAQYAALQPMPVVGTGHGYVAVDDSDTSNAVAVACAGAEFEHCSYTRVLGGPRGGHRLATTADSLPLALVPAEFLSAAEALHRAEAANANAECGS